MYLLIEPACRFDPPDEVGVEVAGGFNKAVGHVAVAVAIAERAQLMQHEVPLRLQLVWCHPLEFDRCLPSTNPTTAAASAGVRAPAAVRDEEYGVLRGVWDQQRRVRAHQRRLLIGG
jgi:hypothetical protein